jgi:hypothetical protein
LPENRTSDSVFADVFVPVSAKKGNDEAMAKKLIEKNGGGLWIQDCVNHLLIEK